MYQYKEKRQSLIDEAITYRKYVTIIPDVMEIVTAYNGKIADKKMVEQIKAELTGKGFYIYQDNGYDNKSFGIVVSRSGINEASNFHIAWFYKKSDCLTIQEGKKARWNSPVIVEALQKKTTECLNRADALMTDVSNLDSMFAEYESITNQIKAFRGKYDYRVIEKFGIRF